MPHPRVNGLASKNSPRTERYGAGRALRKSVARETYAEYPPASGRTASTCPAPDPFADPRIENARG
ncbi:MAG: hypothetical protein ACREC4_03455 [Methylocella sp.]